MPTPTPVPTTAGGLIIPAGDNVESLSSRCYPETDITAAILTAVNQ